MEINEKQNKNHNNNSIKKTQYMQTQLKGGLGIPIFIAVWSTKSVSFHEESLLTVGTTSSSLAADIIERVQVGSSPAMFVLDKSSVCKLYKSIFHVWIEHI